MFARALVVDMFVVDLFRGFTSIFAIAVRWYGFQAVFGLSEGAVHIGVRERARRSSRAVYAHLIRLR